MMISLNKVDIPSWRQVEQAALNVDRLTLLPKVAAAIVRATTNQVLLVNASESKSRWRLPTVDLSPDSLTLDNLELLIEQLGVTDENTTRISGLVSDEEPIMGDTIPPDTELRATFYLPFLVTVNDLTTATLAGTEWQRSRWREPVTARHMLDHYPNKVEALAMTAIMDRVASQIL